MIKLKYESVGLKVDLIITNKHKCISNSTLLLNTIIISITAKQKKVNFQTKPSE